MHRSSVLDVFYRYFLVLQYFRGYAEFGWWCQRNRARCANLLRSSRARSIHDQLSRSYSCRGAGENSNDATKAAGSRDVQGKRQ